MNYVYNFVNSVKYYYDSMNPAFLSGAIDVIVVEQPDGSYLSTPFHVRFGRYGVWNFDDKYVDIHINDAEMEQLKMKLGENGVAYFVEETREGEKVPLYLAADRIPSAPSSPSAEARAGDDGQLPSASTSTGQQPKKLSLADGPTSARLQGEGGQQAAGAARLHLRRHRSLPDLTSINRQRGMGAEMDGIIGSRRRTPSTDDDSRSSTPIGGSSEKLSKGKAKGKGKKGKMGDATAMMDEEQLASGALSDSELSRENPRILEQGHTEWKWGEIPADSQPKQRARDVNISGEGDANKSHAWSWFSWSRRQQPDAVAEAVSADALADATSSQPPNASTTPDASAPNVKKQEKAGVYLEDLADDPSKMAAYFGGKRTGAASVSSNVDSGTGSVSLATSPSSPSALSLNEATAAAAALGAGTPNGNGGGGGNMTDSTTTLQNNTPTREEITTALLKDEVVEREILANADPVPAPSEIPLPKRRYYSGQSSASEFGLSDEEASSAHLVECRYKRSLRLASDRLRSLGLNYGSNEARFSITTKFQGTAWCSCHIYLFKWTEKLVISDIDGTITKSDVLGHVIPAIGGTWAHSAVAELYTRIRNNGYQMVYLSSRAIGQSHYTKSYLQNIAQGSKRLPDGPVLLSPTSVLMAFRKEVIERRPYEFKIACLADLKALFPSGTRPFFAGFGNRPTDVKSYVAVGVPLEHILIINPSGVVSRADQTGYVSDYASMANETVDFIFPPLKDVEKSNSPELIGADSYSNFIFWHNQHNTLKQLDEEDLDLYESARKVSVDQQRSASEVVNKKKSSSREPAKKVVKMKA